MGTGGPFPGGKARPGLDADHSPPSSAKVVNEQELYLLHGYLVGLLCACYLLYVYKFIKYILTHGCSCDINEPREWLDQG
jgi:hypothetical protein